MHYIILLLFVSVAYGQGIVCNYNEPFACVCRDESYPPCDSYVEPNQPLTTVLIEFDEPASGSFETAFKIQVANAVFEHCNNSLHECQGSVVKPVCYS